MKFLVIIPARCGSKGIPFKNIVDVCGRPLVQYTIDLALQLKSSQLVDNIIVSTDCKEIAKISKKLGASVPFLRPDNISGDESKSIEYIVHTLDFFEKMDLYYDAVILLQPTSPLKTYNDLTESIKLFNNEGNDSLISTYREETINNLITYRKDGNIARPLDEKHNQGVRRQEHGSIYIRNGAIYITKVSYIRNNQKIVSDLPLMHEMNKNNSINIDTPEDLEYLRNILCK
jgi:CMP-N,N'-diacetyllegionaminic acid synthase